MSFWPYNSRLDEALAKLESAEREIDLLKSQLRESKARLAILEADEREIRLNLLRRSGILPSASEIDRKERELKPVKKTVLPWAQQAAKLEADSKERYWKKQIDLRERKPEERKQDQQNQEQKDFNQDMEELNNVSAS